MPWFTVQEELWIQAGAEVDAHGRTGSGVRRRQPGRGSWRLSATGGRPHRVDAIADLWVRGLVVGDRAGRLGYGWWHGNGQGEDHGEAAAGRLLGDESSVHGFGEPAGQSEAKADAAVVAAAADALEGLEHAVAVAGRDAGPAVGNPQLRPVV